MRTRLLLIDGTNFFFKGNWGQRDLTLNGKSIKNLYAFHLNLTSLVRMFETEDWDTTTIVCWDGGHAERTRISSEAVRAGIIPKTYKQERREAREIPEKKIEEETNNFIQQLEMAEEMLKYTRIHQLRIKGEEADDLVGSFCKSNLGKFNDIVLVTTDKDYYQLLWSGVRIYNSTKDEFIDKKFLFEKYGLDCADQWVDAGALAGESGPTSDTIYGVPGIGIIFACKLIQQYKSLEGVLAKAEDYFRDYILKNGYDTFRDRIRSGEYKPTKFLKEAKVLAYRDVLEIAFKLKKMRTEIDIQIPEINPDWRALDDFFRSVKFNISPRNFDTFLRRIGVEK